MAGRRATPDYLKLVLGNPGKRAIDTAPDAASSAAPDTLQPERPDHLDDLARLEWDRIVPDLMRLNILQRVDRAALAMYCQAYSRWQRAELKIQKLYADQEARGLDGAGLVVKAKNGFEQLSQWLIISNRAQEQLKSYLVEFGMTPSARARVKAMKVQGVLFPEDDPMEALLRAGSRAA